MLLLLFALGLSGLLIKHIWHTDVVAVKDSFWDGWRWRRCPLNRFRCPPTGMSWQEYAFRRAAAAHDFALARVRFYVSARRLPA